MTIQAIPEPGSATLFFLGIPTREGQTWFTYFRFYTPSAPYFDKSWQLNDIEEVK